MWLLLLVLIVNGDPVKSGDTIKFAVPDHWFPTEAACNDTGALYAEHFRQTEHAHGAFICFQPPPANDGAT